jgi:uncharacterized membrane protein YfcA
VRQSVSALLPVVVMLLVVGALAGVIAGLLGVGGGIVLVPAFYYTFDTLGYDSPQIMQVCIATSLATIIVTSARSLRAHNKKGAVDWAVLRGWGPGIAAGAILGVLTAGGMRTTSLMLVFGVLGTIVGLYLAFGRDSWRLGDQMPAGLTRALASPAIGFLSVLMGIGGGSFGVPTMRLYGMPIHRAVATASGFGLLIAVPSVTGFLASGWQTPGKPPLTIGLVNLPAFLVIIAMTLLTAPLGVRLAHAMNPKPLRRVFAFFIMTMALNMLRKAVLG